MKMSGVSDGNHVLTIYFSNMKKVGRSKFISHDAITSLNSKTNYFHHETHEKGNCVPLNTAGSQEDEGL